MITGRLEGMLLASLVGSCVAASGYGSGATTVGLAPQARAVRATWSATRSTPARAAIWRFTKRRYRQLASCRAPGAAAT